MTGARSVGTAITTPSGRSPRNGSRSSSSSGPGRWPTTRPTTSPRWPGSICDRRREGQIVLDDPIGGPPPLTRSGDASDPIAPAKPALEPRSAQHAPRPRLVLATLNRAKARELAGLLGDTPYELHALAELPGAALPEETGDTYRANALLKARAAARLTGACALADDSGIEVAALGGAPGVHSARFGGPGLDDAARCALLLDALRGVPPEARAARFRCVAALVDPESQET